MAKIMIEIPDEQYKAAIEVSSRIGLRQSASVANICYNAVVNGTLITECEAEDCISREQAYESAKCIFESNSEAKAFCMMKMLKELPSIYPKSDKPSGKWIRNAPDYDMQNTQYICSECGNAHTRITPYCEM